MSQFVASIVSKVADRRRLTAAITGGVVAALIAFASLPALADNQDSTSQSAPEITAYFYAEDFNYRSGDNTESGYSGLSFRLAPGYLNHFSQAYSGYVELDFSINSDESTLTATELWLKYEAPPVNDVSWELTVGSHSVFDSHGWLYDTTIDGFSVRASWQQWSSFLSFGTDTQQFFLQSRDEYHTRIMAGLTKQWQESRKVSLMLTALNDNSRYSENTESNDVWLSLITTASFNHTRYALAYRAQAAALFGQQTNHSIDIESDAAVTSTIEHRGWAYDAAATLSTKWPGSPELTVAFARTSGDSNPDDNNNTQYRQPDIYSNSADIGRASSLPLYARTRRSSR
ncbi:MAG: hypothetical protein AAF404_04755, partial [Pseudomonadota bacterium]